MISSTYNGIITKMRGMQGRLLTPEDYRAMAGMKDVPSVITYLKDKTAYGPYIEKMPPELYNRINVERMLAQSLYSDYSRLYRFADLPVKKFLKLYWKHTEVELISYCFSVVFSHAERPFDLDVKKEIFDQYSGIGIDRLVTAKSVNELVDRLAGTEYYEPLRHIREASDAKLYDYELALQIYTFTNMWKKGQKLLKGKDMEDFLLSYGTRIDLVNIQWIYRAKKHYHMIAPDIYAMVIPIHAKIREPELRAMVEAETVEAFEAVVKKTRYGDRYHLFSDTKTLDRAYQDILRGVYHKTAKKNPYSMSALLDYLYRKEDEIRRVTTLMECVRYGLTAEEAKEYLGEVL